MDPVHDKGSMDPVHESGPWTQSKVGVHGPLVHVLSSPEFTGFRSPSNALSICNVCGICEVKTEVELLTTFWSKLGSF